MVPGPAHKLPIVHAKDCLSIEGLAVRNCRLKSGCFSAPILCLHVVRSNSCKQQYLNFLNLFGLERDRVSLHKLSHRKVYVRFPGLSFALSSGPMFEARSCGWFLDLTDTL